MHEPLPVKYRPTRFEDILGQEINVRYLSSLIKKGQIGKNIIFYGPFGGGKTTSARIFARALNCKNPSPSGSPCNVCENCMQDLALEIDAASAGNKETIQELLELAKTPPLFGKYRVVILDETQNLSKAAWDALLKTIEEPKEFQVWLFSTTELEKIRPAVKSRCQVLEIKTLPADICKQHLQYICKQENLTYENVALDIISFMSKGHARDLLKNLEQISYLGDITVDNAKIIFNLGYLHPLVDLALALCKSETKTFLPILHSFSESPKKITELLKQFFLYFYYKFEQNVSVEINPSFDLIPEMDKIGIWKSMSVLQKNFQDVLASINTLCDSSYISLEISLLELHVKLYKKESEEVLSFGTVEKPKRKRQFVTVSDYKPQEPSVQAIEKKEPVTPIPEAPSKVYAHTLLSNGFISIPLERESDLIIVE